MFSDRRIVLVMGPTGVGKSNFIDKLFGGVQGNRRAGDNLKSHTSEVSTSHDRGNLAKSLGCSELVVVDTPGFDDTERPDWEILQLVANWLKETYEKEEKLAVIIYLHRILDNRVTGSLVKNLRMFGQLTGGIAASRVWMTTTMWDNLNLNTDMKEKRHQELVSVHWKALMDQGGHSAKFDNTRASAFKVVDDALKAQDAEDGLLLQQEFLTLQRKLGETSAGRELYSDLQKLLKSQKQAVEDLAKQARDSGNQAIAAGLEVELDRISRELDKTFQSIDKLKISIGQRIKLFFAKKARTRAIVLG